MSGHAHERQERLDCDDVVHRPESHESTQKWGMLCLVVTCGHGHVEEQAAEERRNEARRRQRRVEGWRRGGEVGDNRRRKHHQKQQQHSLSAVDLFSYFLYIVPCSSRRNEGSNSIELYHSPESCLDLSCPAKVLSLGIRRYGIVVLSGVTTCLLRLSRRHPTDIRSHRLPSTSTGHCAFHQLISAVAVP